MKVLIISNKFPPNVEGGAEMVAAACADGLVARGHEVMVITENSEVPSVERAGYVIHRVRSHNLPRARDQGTVSRAIHKLGFHARDALGRSSLAEVERLVRAFAPDVANTNNIQGLGYRTWEWLGRMNLPTLVTLHDYSLGCLNQSRFQGGMSCAKDHLPCAVTGKLKQYWLSCIKTLGIAAPSTYLLEREALRLPAHSLFRSQWHLPLVIHENSALPVGRKNLRRLGFIGRLVTAKGAHLIPAIGDALGGEFPIDVAGSGELQATIEAACSERTWLTYQKFLDRSQIATFLANIDLLLVPSQWDEIYSLVVREAMHYGIPSLVSNRGALPELVGDASGLVVSSDDVKDWAKAISTLSKDQLVYENLSANCLTRAKLWNNVPCINQYEVMLTKLAENGPQC